LNPAQAPGLS